MDRKLNASGRYLLLVAGGLAVLAGPILLLFPMETGAYFAWKISHPLTPLFLGANYLGGLGALWAARLDRWSVARVQVPGILIFSVTQLAATLLHLQAFNWGHPVAWAWLIVYVTSPPAALYVYVTMQKGSRFAPAEPDGPSFPVVSGFRIFSAISFLLGLALIVWPALSNTQDLSSVIPWWAWSLTPLTARVAGGWYLAGASLYWMLGRQQAVRVMGPSLLGVAIVTGSQLAGSLIWRHAFDGPTLAVFLYWLYTTVVFVFAASLLVTKWPFFPAGSQVEATEE